MAISQDALDSIDRFIAVAGDMAHGSLLARPEHKASAEDLYQISQRLQVSNENMARWLSEFLYFDFRAADAQQRFLALTKAYETTKKGPGFHSMKFPCGEIRQIYEQNIEGRIDEFFGGDTAAAQDARDSFTELGDLDDDMVAFIHEEVIRMIDGFVTDVEHDPSNLSRAEVLRLKLRVAAAPLSARLDRFASELAEMVVQFAALAGRKVTLTFVDPPGY